MHHNSSDEQATKDTVTTSNMELAGYVLPHEVAYNSKEPLHRRRAPRPQRPLLCSPMEILDGDEMKEYLKQWDFLAEEAAEEEAAG